MSLVTRQTPPTHRPRRQIGRDASTPATLAHRNHGWGKLVGAVVGGVAGALTLQLPGAITGLIVGAAAGHWLDVASEPARQLPVPHDAHEIAREAAQLAAAQVRDAAAALERAAGRTAPRVAVDRFLRDQLHLDSAMPAAASTLPWQQDVASACTRLAEILDPAQKEALVRTLFDHARALGLGDGPARLLLRDGVAALGISADEEERLRETDAML